jgi:DnaJ-class molecular chaperone
MTPWAVLQVRPTARQADIRHAYYKLARNAHPDVAAQQRQGNWEAISTAYSQVKTPELRASWEAHRSGLAKTSHCCATCKGWGVAWSKLGRAATVKVCTTCQGKGRK